MPFYQFGLGSNNLTRQRHQVPTVISPCNGDAQVKSQARYGGEQHKTILVLFRERKAETS
jgi:hypothetical protein